LNTTLAEMSLLVRGQVTVSFCRLLHLRASRAGGEGSGYSAVTSLLTTYARVLRRARMADSQTGVVICLGHHAELRGRSCRGHGGESSCSGHAGGSTPGQKRGARCTGSGRVAYDDVEGVQLAKEPAASGCQATELAFVSKRGQLKCQRSGRPLLGPQSGVNRLRSKGPPGGTRTRRSCSSDASKRGWRFARAGAIVQACCDVGHDPGLECANLEQSRP
jgi:hypothetical protein